VREDVTLGCRACHKPFFGCVDEDGEQWHFLLAEDPAVARIRAEFETKEAQHQRQDRERTSAWNNPHVIAEDLKELSSATGRMLLGRLADIGRKLRGG
jgi:hypothetical protein